MITILDARRIAQELYKLMRKDMKDRLAEAVANAEDEFLSHREAAEFLCTTPSALYVRKDVPYMKVGRKRIYSRNALTAFVRNGIPS